MSLVKVRIDLPFDVEKEYRYAWDLFARHFNCNYHWVDENEDLLIGETDPAHIIISSAFLNHLRNQSFTHEKIFPEEPLVRTSIGTPDYLSTAFYMVNSLQEYNNEVDDYLGRFPYQASYQYRFDCYKEDLVSKYFQALLEETPPLKEKIATENKPSKVFLTHDIDRVYQGIYREGKWALKKGNLRTVLKLIWDHFVGTPTWFNFNNLVEIHQEMDFSSTFFWLPKKGRDEKGILNADYDINSAIIQAFIRKVHREGFGSGLHKSTFSTSFLEEMSLLEEIPLINRNHYLRIKIPGHYKKLEEAGLKLDTSLGFSEVFGFRNSYARPFQPFDLEGRRKFDLLEIPMNIMDQAIFSEQTGNLKEKEEALFKFLEANKYNSILTILWHNNYLTPYRYKESLNFYKKMLQKIRDLGCQSITPKELTYFIDH